MKCAIAKHSETVLKQAIKHYSKRSALFTFMSLYDDNEPYPLDEVIEVIKLKIKDLKTEVNEWQLNEALKTRLFVMEKHLINLESRKEKLNQ